MKTPATILLAEDDPNDEDLIRLALEQSDIDCQLEVVHDGVAVIDYLFGSNGHANQSPHAMPKLILLDLKMPKMSGLQVLQVFRRVRSNEGQGLPPVVALTSSSEDHDINEAYQWGANSYICKPVDYEAFSRTVRRVVGYWLDLNRAPRWRGRLEPAAPAC